MRIELAQIRKYSPSDDIVNEIIYFVYDKKRYTGGSTRNSNGNIVIKEDCRYTDRKRPSDPDLPVRKGAAVNYEKSDLIRIAKRENNNKRGYLLVNPLQAKHIPVSPSKALGMFSALKDRIGNRYDKERLLVIGFAETATAIGAHLAISLKADYIQTTREEIEGAEYLFFSEEHSHASQQRLVLNGLEKVLPETDRIIFAEDEVTTGKTIRNLIAVLKKSCPEHVKFTIASVLNGMSEENAAFFKEQGIDLIYLLKTDHSSYEEIAESFAGNGIFHPPVSGETYSAPVFEAFGAVNPRKHVSAGQYEAGCRSLREQLKNLTGIETGKRILVLGTEECMYPSVFAASGLEDADNEVRCHSTTRSPILVSLEDDYPLRERFELYSVYDGKRRTFLYNIDCYDMVLVITDAPDADSAGMQSLLHALRSRNQDIRIILWRP